MRQLSTIFASITTLCVLVVGIIVPLPGWTVDPKNVSSPVQVTIVDAAPATFTNEDKLTVTVRITNPSRTKQSGTGLLFISTGSTLSPQNLIKWLLGDGRAFTYFDTIDEQRVELSAASSKELKIVVPRAKLPNTGTWGPRGLSFTFRSDSGLDSENASDQSLVMFDNGEDVHKTAVLNLLPVTGAESDFVTATQTNTLGQTGMGPGSRSNPPVYEQAKVTDTTRTLPANASSAILTRLSATATKGTLLYVDPAVVDSTSPLLTGGTYPISGTKMPLPATLATTALAQANKQGADVAISPWGALPGGQDASLRPLAEKRQLDTGLALSNAGVLAETNIKVFDRYPTAAELSGLPSGATVFLPEDALAVPDFSTYTPSARLSLADVTGKLGAFAVNTAATSALRLTPTESTTDFDLDQLAVAIPAIITSERPYDSRLMVAQLPPNPTRQQLLRAQKMQRSRWAAPTDLAVAREFPRINEDAHLLQSPEYQAFSEAEGTLAKGTGSENGQTAGSNSGITAEAQKSLQLLSQLTSENLIYPFASQILLSHSTTSLAQLRKDAYLLTHAVHFGPSSTINLISPTANLPVRVTNELQTPVTVVLSGKPSHSRLKTPKPLKLSMQGNSVRHANMTLETIGNGNADLQVGLSSQQGTYFGDKSVFQIRIRAGIEDNFLLTLGVISGIVFIIGLVKAFRKGRPSIRRRIGKANV